MIPTKTGLFPKEHRKNGPCVSIPIQPHDDQVWIFGPELLAGGTRGPNTGTSTPSGRDQGMVQVHPPVIKPVVMGRDHFLICKVQIDGGDAYVLLVFRGGHEHMAEWAHHLACAGEGELAADPVFEADSVARDAENAVFDTAGEHRPLAVTQDEV